MARQEGILPFFGKIGDVVGFRRGTENFTKAASIGHNLSEESKKSGTEFGRGSTACVLVKQAFGPLMLRSFKTDLHNRLSEAFRQVIRSGPLRIKGTRGVFDGNISLLKGFEFNPLTAFNKLISFTPNVEISAASVTLTIPAFNWGNGPAKANRMVLGTVCGYFDFNANTWQTTLAGNLIVEKHKGFAGGNLTIQVPNLKQQVVMVMMNVFFEENNGHTSLKFDNRNYQAGILLDVSHIRNGKVIVFEPEELLSTKMEAEIKPDVNWNIHTVSNI